jgi:hypothetical protein
MEEGLPFTKCTPHSKLKTSHFGGLLACVLLSLNKIERIMICRGIACCSVIDVINLPELHLFVDVLPIILEFLPVKEIMRSRRVCKKWKDSVRRAIAHDNFYVDSVEAYNLLGAMVTAMPNLQQITIGYLGNGHKFNDGEDPDERAARTADYTSHDIEILSNFRKLRILEIYGSVLNGRYPVIFSFPLLQKLFINCGYLKWDLEMLAGLPSLKELYFYISPGLTGNINSLRMLKDTLEKVNILYGCEFVRGNFMDLADFPHLKELDLDGTSVTGDIRDIKETDFSSLERLNLPKRVYGGKGYQLQSISDGTDVARAVYLLRKQRPVLVSIEEWYWKLSEASPDWYGSLWHHPRDSAQQVDTPPFLVRFVVAGSRIGYRWETKRGIPCELNWLDPEPDRESSEYSNYIEKLREIESRLDIFQGFYQPPTEEELVRLIFWLGP